MFNVFRPPPPDYGNEPDPDINPHGWAKWMQETDRKVAHAEMFDAEGNTVCKVYTSYFGEYYYRRRSDFKTTTKGPVYETMIHGGPRDFYSRQCYTREDALINHAFAVALALGLFSLPDTDYDDDDNSNDSLTLT
jgi:hypothetical protein